MKTLRLFALSSCFAFAAFPTPVLAHGGQYRGPGDIVPPGGGGGRPNTPGGPVTGGGPRAPGTPNAPGGVPVGTGPRTGGGSLPGGGSGPGRTGGGGAPPVEDLTRWEFWWEINKDPYLRLKDSVHSGPPQTGSDEIWLGVGLRHGAGRDTMKPTEAQILEEVLPALRKAVDSTENRDIASSCMIAMAKVGQDHASFRLVDVFRERLARGDQEVRETAALAIGIAGIAGEREVTLLTSLATDGKEGRAACDKLEVDERTRAFATYGLGLLANRTTNVPLARKVFETLQGLVEDPRSSRDDVRTAAILSIGLLNLDRSAPGATELVDDAVGCLERFYLRQAGPTEQRAQAHCPTAISKLIGRNDPRTGRFARLFAEELAGKGKQKRQSHDIARSCAIALGRLCRPNDVDDAKQNPDGAYSKLLLDTYHDHRDAQTRYFALMALGQIGGARNRDVLLKEFDDGQKAVERPWCALALGVLDFHAQKAQEATGVTPEPDALIGNTLADAFRSAKEPGQRGAYAIGLGLCRWQAASDAMIDAMNGNLAQEEFAGYVCIGLALMDAHAAVGDIRKAALAASRRPTLLQQAAIALGKLGDKTAAADLQQMMTQGEPNLAKLSAIAAALGFIGDRRSITPLKTMLFDSQLGDLARAFAAVALGGIADKEPLRWNSKIGVDTNYRAATETLSNQQSGILDIL
jgi:HEAT repeat protein